MDTFDQPFTGEEILQLRELLSGRDTDLHSHQFDRSVTHSTVGAFQDSEGLKVITSDRLLTVEDDYIFLDSTGGAFAVTLPRARGGKFYCLVRIAGGASVTITPTGADMINGGVSLTITTSYAPLRFKALKNVGWVQV